MHALLKRSGRDIGRDQTARLIGVKRSKNHPPRKDRSGTSEGLGQPRLHRARPGTPNEVRRFRSHNEPRVTGANLCQTALSPVTPERFQANQASSMSANANVWRSVST